MATPATIGDLLQLSALIAVGFLLAVAFYESLCTRDVLVRRASRVARRISRRAWFVAGAYGLMVLVGIPLLVLLWTVVLEIALFFVGSVDRLGSIALVATSVVGATRILAYVREKTSHELAKAIPLSFAFLLLTGGAVNVDQKLTLFAEHPEGAVLTQEMIVFLLGLEIGLRLLTDGSHAVLAAIRRRRGIETDLGVWGTVVAALRRPLPAAVAGPDTEPDALEPSSTDASSPADAFS